MVRSFLIGLLVMVLASAAYAKRIKIYPAEPMLGQAVTLSMPADIPFIEKRFNWAALKHCFAVYGADYGSERVRFTLYPRQVGVCDIKREPWETWEVPSHFVVRPNPDVNVHWHPPATAAWQRQGVRWAAQVSLKSTSGYKAWMEAAQTEKRAWAFSPLQAGTLQALWWPVQAGAVKLGPLFVAVKNPSGQIWRFPSTIQTVNVKPLPVWLPADVLVGRSDELTFTPPMLVAKGEATTVRLVVGGMNLYPDLPPQPETLLPHVPGVRWGYGQAKAHTTWTPAGQHDEVVLSQPLIAERYGLIQLPAVTLQYFDPTLGKVARVVVPTQTLWSLPAWVIGLGKVLLLGVALLMAGLMLRGIWQAGWDLWLAWQARHRDPHGLWQAMLRWYRWRRDPVKRRNTPKTPQQWLACHPRPHRWDAIIQQLQSAFFGKNPP